jgi:hypothetical protein
MNEEDKCMITLTREEIIKNPDLLKSLYTFCDHKKIVDWLLNRKEEEKPAEVKNEETVCCDSDCIDRC